MCRKVCSAKLPLGLLISAYLIFPPFLIMSKTHLCKLLVHRTFRTKIGMDHHYTKLVNVYQKLGKILFPSEAISQ